VAFSGACLAVHRPRGHERVSELGGVLQLVRQDHSGPLPAKREALGNRRFNCIPDVPQARPISLAPNEPSREPLDV
jgi:hypothetical protein